jgi:hypothetical protein
MEKQSVRSAWSGSAWVLVAACNVAAAQQQVLALEQEDLKQPDRVAAWVQAHPQGIDQEKADFFLRIGARAKKGGDWGLAVKSFGESAMYFPSSPVLMEYAHAYARLLGEIRARNNAYSTHKQNDLTGVQSLYQTALAVDAVTRQLSERQRREIRAGAECLAHYLRAGVAQRGCEPLDAYGLKQ